MEGGPHWTGVLEMSCSRPRGGNCGWGDAGGRASGQATLLALLVSSRVLRLFHGGCQGDKALLKSARQAWMALLAVFP